MGKGDNARERLLVLLDYWIEHNREHGHEYKGWIQRIKDMGYAGISEEILESVELTETVQHHFLHARDLLTSGKLVDEFQKYHEQEETHKHHQHEHITFHVIGVIHTPYLNTHPERAEENDGEFFLEIYRSYEETIARFEPGVQVLVVYAKHTSTGDHLIVRDAQDSQFNPNPIDVITVTVQRYEQGKIMITPVPVRDGAQILLLK